MGADSQVWESRAVGGPSFAHTASSSHPAPCFAWVTRRLPLECLHLLLLRVQTDSPLQCVSTSQAQNLGM